MMNRLLTWRLLKNASFGLFACLATSACAERVHWESRAPMPRGNGGFASGVIEDRIVIAGGVDWRDGVKQTLDQVWHYDPTGDAWSIAQPLPSPIAYAAVASDDQGIVALGGDTGNGALQQMISIAPDQRVRVREAPWSSVYAGAAVLEDWLYIVAGGASATDLAQLHNQMHRISRSDGQVEALPDYPGGAVMLPAVAQANGTLYVFGGARYDAARGGVTNVNAAFAYDMSDQSWRRLRSLPAAMRGSVSLVLNERWVVIVGGYGQLESADSEENFSDAVLLYAIDEDRYYRSSPLPEAVMRAGVVKMGAYLYVFGGEDRVRHRSHAMYRCHWPSVLLDSRVPLNTEIENESTF